MRTPPAESHTPVASNVTTRENVSVLESMYPACLSVTRGSPPLASTHHHHPHYHPRRPSPLSPHPHPLLHPSAPGRFAVAMEIPSPAPWKVHLEGAGEGQTIISLFPNTQTLVFVEVILAWFGRVLGGGLWVSVCRHVFVCLCGWWVFRCPLPVHVQTDCERRNTVTRSDETSWWNLSSFSVYVVNIDSNHKLSR